MTYDARIERLPIYALFDLKGPQKELNAWCKDRLSFPNDPNTRTRNDSASLCHIGPNRWLLRDALENEAALIDALKPETAPAEISIVRVSDTQTFFRITGPDAAEVMSIGCPLDLHDAVFAPDASSYTEFFGVKALVLRCEDGFECAVEQSYGNMIEDFLTRAMA
ncbi:sarcosine oxidase subunit gamma [Aliiroseovarius sp. YM-037]|uniref:sarcosine oxidase subunit gamma n=1 Tax=Aliiroseovarius sp. YM-037 TaxID=3341728 RepID=UPI003A7F9D21